MSEHEMMFKEIQEIKQMISSIPQAPATIPPEIINTDELCKRLGISEPTAIKWRNKKKIPSFKLGDSVRYNWPKVVEFLESKSSTK